MGMLAWLKSPPTPIKSDVPSAETFSSYSDLKDDDGEYFLTRPEQKRKIRFAQKGCGSKEVVPPETLVELFRKSVARHGNEPAMSVERPVPDPTALESTWKTWTWNEYYNDVRKFAMSLLHVGLNDYEGVTIWGFNSPEWAIAFFGTIFSGGIPAGLYPTDNSETVAFKTNHIDARVAVVHSLAHVDKYKASLNDIPTLSHIVVYKDDDPIPENAIAKREDGTEVRIISWMDFLSLGESSVSDATLNGRMDELQPEDCAAIVFTSGTTGRAKATMLSHDNLNFCCRAVLARVPSFAPTAQQPERILSYLPLSHIAALQLDLVGPLLASSYKDGNSTVYFARPTDLKTGKLVDRMRYVKPTSFLGVPLVWERIMEKLQRIGSKTTGVKRFILNWAKRKTLLMQTNLQMGGSGSVPFFYSIANILVKGTLEFFGALGINIHEAYGASESSAVVSMTDATHHIWGSIGAALEGCEIKLLDLKGNVVPLAKDLFHPEEHEQGEICFRGRNVMLGYMVSSKGDDRETVEKKNRETITKDGWCKTGDKACMDERGMIRFTGRFKELIKGKGGEIIAPVPIEASIAARAPALSKVVVIGDNRDYTVALCTLVQEGANGDQPGTGELAGMAQDVSPRCQTTEDAMTDPNWENYIKQAIEQVNADKRICLNHAFKVRRFTILPRDFSIERDENTPTLKFKRSVIEQNYKAQIEQLYANPLNENADVEYVCTSEAEGSSSPKPEKA